MLKEKYLKFKEQGIAQECLLVSLCFFLLVWVLFVATPFDIVAANSEEFTSVPGISILWHGLFYALSALISLVVLYVLISFTFKKYIRKFLLFTLIAFSLSVWLNSTFLTGVYGEFNGRDNLQIAPFGLLNWIQIGAFLIIFALAIYFSNRTKIFIYIIASIFLISFSVSTINIASKLSEKKIKQGSEKKFFTYSKNNPNLLFILLDEYQSDYFSEILDDKLKGNLNGFIWFKDAASNFPTTIVAVAAMLTGDIYDNTVDILDFFKASSDHSIAKKFPGGQVNHTPGSDILDLFGNLLGDTDPALSGARNPHVLYVNEGCCAPGALTPHNELRFPKRSILSCWILNAFSQGRHSTLNCIQ
ncbi:hypothetical protein REG_1085 [Candidatus Regiella insecticola LSR1]|uniref:Sulfatase N-terminal domain-containing protein n=1 Tax=Candidatus Regiella insecticola LSR1 TaxID=663321 RepID=E0WSV7_9ENTR|nr:hypothetical protein [Candidatus Regiella insecticola]EFL91642.1 hypothetical protein REG_1085 [Candidatus Regiella insecticola LSR1]